MNKAKVGVIAGIVAALAVAGGVTAVATLGAPATDPETAIHQMNADYPAFDSAADMTRASALVVRATAVEIGPAYRDIPAGLAVDKLPAHKAAQVGTVQHDVTFRVDEVLRGKATGATVTVVQLGGQIGNDRYVAEGEPSSVKNSSYLLFLAPLRGGRFGIVGGPQGRYLIEHGTIKILDAESGARGAGSQLHGMQVAAVAARLGG